MDADNPSGRHYRAMLYVNGWQMGNYVSDIGPQHSFPIPNGVLRPQERNSIVIAVWKIDQTEGGLGEVSLVNYGSYKSGLVMPTDPGLRATRFALSLILSPITSFL